MKVFLDKETSEKEKVRMFQPVLRQASLSHSCDSVFSIDPPLRLSVFPVIFLIAVSHATVPAVPRTALFFHILIEIITVDIYV